jgi:predicted O-methyltransferase YrrM
VHHSLEDPRVGDALDVVAGLAPLGPHGLHLAHTEALAEQVVQANSPGEHLAADLGVRELDPGFLPKGLESLHLDEGDVATTEVAVTGKALVRHVDSLDRLRQLFVLRRDSDRLYESRHDDQSTLPCVVRILDEVVERYFRDLRPERSELMREMEELAERDSVPIVHWETGRLLAVFCRVLDPVVLEVGTAIGYSTLHMAEQLERGRVITLERDPDRAAQARSYLERGGVADRVEIVEGDALETLPGVEGPFDLLFVDASKGEYARYIELAEPKLSERALMVVDNLLMSGEVALPEDAETRWNPDSLTSARRLNSELVGSERWLACVLPVGDGIGVAARR